MIVTERESIVGSRDGATPQLRSGLDMSVPTQIYPKATPSERGSNTGRV